MQHIERIRKTDNNALVIEHTRATKGWEQWYLLTSDNHFDNPEADHKLEDRHLDLAIERDAAILNIGDLFDAMQGKNDKRGSKAKLRKQYLCRAYWDSLVDDAVNRYGRVANRWVGQGYGNHETSVLNGQETDLIQRFAARMNGDHKGIMEVLGYSGFIRFSFSIGSSKFRKTMFFTHGHGGGGKTTQGMGGMMRLNHNIDGADIMICGHTHNAYHVDFMKTEMNPKGRLVDKTVDLLNIPTYKDGYNKGHEGWEAERGLGAKPKGAWWMRFFFISKKEGIGVDFTRAR